jgi:predicted RNA binding protein YcfA (HicA-like mRNA interferase family)
MTKEIRKLIRELSSRGWVYEHRKSGHLRFIHPSGRYVTTSLTPSDWRAMLKIRQDIRRVEDSCNQEATA